jgi:hypothetical protein
MAAATAVVAPMNWRRESFLFFILSLLSKELKDCSGKKIPDR